MPQVFYKDGKPVPDAKISEAIASGEAFAKGRVTVRDPSGTIGTIDASELGKPGYQPLTDAEINAERIHQERSTLGQQALTVGEGAVRGATLGTSDLVTTGLLGDEYRQAAEERAAENKRLAVGSEVLGAIAPTLLTGGEGAAVEGASLAARAERGASLLGRVAEYAPSSLVARGGRAVERGVAGIIGESAPSMLGRMAQRAAAIGASGAVEGGLYGAGSAVSQAALDGTPITAEKVLGGFGHGALFGGGLGVGLGALGGLGSSAFERIVGSKGLQEGAAKLANESALKAVGFQGSDFRKLIGRRAGEAAENKIADVGSELLNYTFDSGPLKGQKLFTGAKKAEDFVDDLALAREEVGAKLGAIKSQVDAAGMAPDVESYLARVKAEVLDPLYKSSSPTIRDQAQRVERELALLEERAAASRPPALADPDEVARFLKSQPEFDALDDFLGGGHRRASGYWNDGGFEGATKRVGKEAAAKQKAFFDQVNEIVTKADEAGMTAPGTVYSGRKWTQAKIDEFLKNPRNGIWSTSTSEKQALEFALDNVYGDLKPVMLEIEQRSGVPVSRLQGAGTLRNEEEILLGSDRKWEVAGHAVENTADGPVVKIKIREAGTHAPAPPPTFSELDKFRQDLRSVFQPARPAGGGLPAPVPEHAAHLERVERILADELDKTVERHLAEAGLDTSEYAKAKKTYGALADIEKVANKAAAQQLGNRALSPSDYGTGMATAIGAMLSGNVGGALMGGAGAVAHKIIRERGRSVLAVMADSVAKMDGRIADAAKSLAGLTSAPRRAVTVGATAPTVDFDRTAAAVRAFASNPQAASVALSRPVEGIAPEHPQLAAQMQQTLAGDYQYLQSKLPQSLGRASSSLTPQLEKATVPRVEQAKFMAVVHALENPASVIEKIAAGELPREQIEALKVRRPEIYNQMRTETIKAFSNAKAPRNILERTRVSLAFDFNGDASLDPPTLAAIQASNRTQPIPDDQPAKDGQQAPQQGKQLNPKSAETLATPSQKAIGS